MTNVREYIGSRYVPLFADPIVHDSTKTYEPLTIVTYQGNSYTSRQYVPAGIAISNTDYWALTGNYNAQVEQYRQEVNAFDNRIDALEDALPIASFNNETVKNYIDDNAAKKKICVYIGNSYTGGVGSTGGNKGFKYYTENMFDESYLFAGSGYGFGIYTDHTLTYYDLIQDAAESSQFNNDDVTDIIVTSAMGDTRSVAEGHEQSVASNFNNFVQYVRNNFPNAQIWLHYAECVYGRNTQQSYSEQYWIAQLRTNYMFERYSLEFGVNYLGWTGWNVNNVSGYNAEDNYHPNDKGYKAIVGAFLSAWHGGSPYNNNKVSTFNLGANLLLTAIAIAPNQNIIKFHNSTIAPSYFDSIASNATNDILAVVDENTLPTVVPIFPSGEDVSGDVRIPDSGYFPFKARTSLYDYGDKENEYWIRFQFAYDTPTYTGDSNLVIYSTPSLVKFHPSANLKTFEVG